MASYKELLLHAMNSALTYKEHKRKIDKFQRIEKDSLSEEERRQAGELREIESHGQRTAMNELTLDLQDLKLKKARDKQKYVKQIEEKLFGLDKDSQNLILSGLKQKDKQALTTQNLSGTISASQPLISVKTGLEGDVPAPLPATADTATPAMSSIQEQVSTQTEPPPATQQVLTPPAPTAPTAPPRVVEEEETVTETVESPVEESFTPPVRPVSDADYQRMMALDVMGDYYDLKMPGSASWLKGVAESKRMQREMDELAKELKNEEMFDRKSAAYSNSVQQAARTVTALAKVPEKDEPTAQLLVMEDLKIKGFDQLSPDGQQNMVASTANKLVQVQAGKFIQKEPEFTTGDPVVDNTAYILMPSTLDADERKIWMNLIKNAVKKDNDSQGDNKTFTQGLIQTWVSNSMTAEPKSRFAATQELIRSIDRLRGLYGEYIKAGGTQGLVVGAGAQMRKWLGMPHPEGLADLTNRINLEVAELRKNFSGAAFSEKEGREYRGFFPVLKDPLNEVFSKLNALENRSYDKVYGILSLHMGGHENRRHVFGKTPVKAEPSITEQMLIDVTDKGRRAYTKGAAVQWYKNYTSRYGLQATQAALGNVLGENPADEEELTEEKGEYMALGTPGDDDQKPPTTEKEERKGILATVRAIYKPPESDVVPWFGDSSAVYPMRRVPGLGVEVPTPRPLRFAASIGRSFATLVKSAVQLGKDLGNWSVDYVNVTDPKKRLIASYMARGANPFSHIPFVKDAPLQNIKKRYNAALIKEGKEPLDDVGFQQVLMENYPLFMALGKMGGELERVATEGAPENATDDEVRELYPILSSIADGVSTFDPFQWNKHDRFKELLRDEPAVVAEVIATAFAPIMKGASVSANIVRKLPPIQKLDILNDALTKVEKLSMTTPVPKVKIPLTGLQAGGNIGNYVNLFDPLYQALLVPWAVDNVLVKHFAGSLSGYLSRNPLPSGTKIVKEYSPTMGQIARGEIDHREILNMWTTALQGVLTKKHDGYIGKLGLLRTADGAALEGVNFFPVMEQLKTDLKQIAKKHDIASVETSYSLDPSVSVATGGARPTSFKYDDYYSSTHGDINDPDSDFLRNDGTRWVYSDAKAQEANELMNMLNNTQRSIVKAGHFDANGLPMVSFEELDALRTEMRIAFDRPGTTADPFVKRVYNDIYSSITDRLENRVPGYKDMKSEYAKITFFANQLEEAFGIKGDLASKEGGVGKQYVMTDKKQTAWDKINNAMHKDKPFYNDLLDEFKKFTDEDLEGVMAGWLYTKKSSVGPGIAPARAASSWLPLLTSLYFTTPNNMGIILRKWGWTKSQITSAEKWLRSIDRPWLDLSRIGGRAVSEAREQQTAAPSKSKGDFSRKGYQEMLDFINNAPAAVNQ